MLARFLLAVLRRDYVVLRESKLCKRMNPKPLNPVSCIRR